MSDDYVEMSMKKVIITAANSFIGYRLCKRMAEQGYYIYALVRSENKNNVVLNSLKNVKIINERMENYKNLPTVIGESCDIGIALAWNGTRGAARDDTFKQEKNYIYSMDSIISFAKMECQVIVTAGSQAEYGPWEGTEKLDESTPCKPNTEYGKYKLKLYHQALKLCESNNIRLIEPRFFSLYGPDDYEGTMIISTIDNMLQNKPCMLTECIQMWDFLYVDDAVEALHKLIASKRAHGVYNFGTGTAKKLKEYVMLMHRLTGSNSKLIFGAIPYPATGIVHTNPSILRLTGEISWKPRTTFVEGIEHVINNRKTV